MGLGIPCPILNAGYGQWVISAFTMHDQFCPPVPAALPWVPGLLEGPMPMGNPAGKLSHKTALTVLADGNPSVKQGHDVGYLIPHFAIPMNANCAINTIFSKHKVMFPVSSVQIKGSPAGTYLAFIGGEICCNPVSLPTGIVLLFKCTVWTSPAGLDFIKGLLYIAMDVVFDAIWTKFTSKTFSALTKKLQRSVLVVVLCGFLRFPNLTTGLLANKGVQILAGHVLPKLGSKVVDHLCKSWVVSPVVTGLPRGAPAVWRGDYSYKFFSNKPWW